MLKAIFAAFVVVLGATLAQAQPSTGPAATGLEVYEFGTYASHPGVEVGKSVAGFSHSHLDAIELLQSTRTIIAQVGREFGFRYRITGKTAGASVPLTIVLKFPPEGVPTPDHTTRVVKDGYTEIGTVGEDAFLTWKFDQLGDLVPGIWQIEIWQGDKKLGEQSFNVILPPVS